MNLIKNSTVVVMKIIEITTIIVAAAMKILIEIAVVVESTVTIAESTRLIKKTVVKVEPWIKLTVIIISIMTATVIIIILMPIANSGSLAITVPKEVQTTPSNIKPTIWITQLNFQDVDYHRLDLTTLPPFQLLFDNHSN